MIPVITIDGPSGAGKGTISQLVANKLNYHFLDSGALYRLTALAVQKQALNLDDVDALSELALHLPVNFKDARIFLNDEDVTNAIRREDISQLASKVAAIPALRAALLQRQRNFQLTPGLVADGRDMGTVVFQQACAKFFLTASAQERAQRRVKQITERGEQADYQKILVDIEERDYRDSHRSVSPLVPADDALEIDTSTLGIEAVLQCVLEHLAVKGVFNLDEGKNNE